MIDTEPREPARYLEISWANLLSWDGDDGHFTSGGGGGPVTWINESSAVWTNESAANWTET